MTHLVGLDEARADVVDADLRREERQRQFPDVFFLIDFYPRSERTWFGAHSAARQRVRFETAPLDEL